MVQQCKATNKQTYLTMTLLLALQKQNGFSSIYHAMYLLENELAWKGLVDVQERQHKATKLPQQELTSMLVGPLHSQSNALINDLATKVCERDEEG